MGSATTLSTVENMGDKTTAFEKYGGECIEKDGKQLLGPRIYVVEAVCDESDNRRNQDNSKKTWTAKEHISLPHVLSCTLPTVL
tara:strand:- start:164 stop:415 length:252 start_codon:yes stop_codon:yes gene_type:complete